MGAGAKDLHAKSRSYSEKYPYKAKGIHVLMMDYGRLKDKVRFTSDFDAAAILCDLERALDKVNLTPRMRQCIALRYFVGLTEQQCAKILGIDRTTVNRMVESALDRLEAFMAFGYMQKENARTDGLLTENHPFISWLNAVASRKARVYSKAPSLTEYLAEVFNDKNAQETIRQRTEGSSFVPDYTGVEEYPYYTEEQFRWADRRMSFVPEVFPTGDVAGTRTIAVKLHDDPYGRDYVQEKQKIFVGRGV